MAYTDTFPTRAAAIEALPDPTHDMFLAGGEHLGIMREFIKCKAPNGEHVTWGSSEKVSISVDDLERVACRIARMGAQQYKDNMLRQAESAEAHESWPGWINDPGQMVAPRGYEVYKTPSGWAYRKLSVERDASRQTPYKQSDEEEFVYYCAWREARREWEQHCEHIAALQTPKALACRDLLYVFFLDAITQDVKEFTIQKVVDVNRKLSAVLVISTLNVSVVSELVKIGGHLAAFDWSTVDTKWRSKEEQQEEAVETYITHFLGKLSYHFRELEDA